MNPDITTVKSVSNPPGGLLIWIVIFLELITFGMALVAMVYYGKVEGDLFRESSSHLNKTYGAINTVFLLCSGYFMAISVKYLKINNNKKAATYLLFTMLFGLLFIGLKSVEYSQKIEQGFVLDTNTFFTFYWLLTAFHVIHVIVGLVILSYFYIQFLWSKDKNSSSISHDDYEAGAAFWHMCDLIWLLLFPIIYLLF